MTHIPAWRGIEDWDRERHENFAEEAARKSIAEPRDLMCPDCRQPNKLTRQERRDHKHCDECTEQCRAAMAPAAHVTFSV